VAAMRVNSAPTAGKLASERDVLRTLEAGTYSLADFYDLAASGTDIARANGHAPIPTHPGDRVWKRRVRGALQDLRRVGLAHRTGRASWVIEGSPGRPTRLLLVVSGATLADFELRLQAAAELLATLDEPADLILCDPPWGLNRGNGRHFGDGNGYRRDHTQVVDGYVDVDPAEYSDFTHEWIAAAAEALRPAGQLAVVTGPQRAAHVQIAAEDAGLTWVSSIAARKTFPLATMRRPASAHWTVTVMTRGALNDKRRVFNPPADQPTARSGHPYPQDWWADNGCANRVKLLRYDNALPMPLVARLVTSFSNPGEHVTDPFLGSGTTAIVCWLNGRHFTGGDLNPNSLRFSAARLLAEHAWAAGQHLALEGAR
jgi:DNA modification methylase